MCGRFPARLGIQSARPSSAQSLFYIRIRIRASVGEHQLSRLDSHFRVRVVVFGDVNHTVEHDAGASLCWFAVVFYVVGHHFSLWKLWMAEP